MTSSNKDFWNRHGALHETYWFHSAVVNAIATLAITFSQIYPHNFQNTHFGILYIITIAIFIFIWNFFITVAIWRIAYNYQGNGVWAVLAIIIVMLGVFIWLGAIGELVRIFALALIELANLE